MANDSDSALRVALHHGVHRSHEALHGLAGGLLAQGKHIIVIEGNSVGGGITIERDIRNPSRSVFARNTQSSTISMSTAFTLVRFQ